MLLYDSELTNAYNQLSLRLHAQCRSLIWLVWTLIDAWRALIVRCCAATDCCCTRIAARTRRRCSANQAVNTWCAASAWNEYARPA
jgi:hypothetical protein